MSFPIKKCAKMGVFFTVSENRNNALAAGCKVPSRRRIFAGFQQESMKLFALFIKNIPLFIAKCNRNLVLSYLVNPSGLFYDDKYSNNDKQRQIQRTIVSRIQLRLHFQKALILLVILWSKGSIRGPGPWHGAPLGEPLPVASCLH